MPDNIDPAIADGADAAAEEAADEHKVDLWGLLENELSEEAHKVAQQLADDMGPLMHKLAGAAAEEVPVIVGQVVKSPFMQHLEAQLPTATLGIVHGLLGLVL